MTDLLIGTEDIARKTDRYSAVIKGVKLEFKKREKQDKAVLYTLEKSNMI